MKQNKSNARISLDKEGRWDPRPKTLGTHNTRFLCPGNSPGEFLKNLEVFSTQVEDLEVEHRRVLWAHFGDQQETRAGINLVNLKASGLRYCQPC